MSIRDCALQCILQPKPLLWRVVCSTRGSPLLCFYPGPRERPWLICKAVLTFKVIAIRCVFVLSPIHCLHIAHSVFSKQSPAPNTTAKGEIRGLNKYEKGMVLENVWFARALFDRSAGLQKELLCDDVFPTTKTERRRHRCVIGPPSPPQGINQRKRRLLTSRSSRSRIGRKLKAHNACDGRRHDVVLGVVKDMQLKIQTGYVRFCSAARTHYIRPHNRRFSWIIMSVKR